MRLKTIHKLVLKSYLGPLVLTFFIVTFVLMMNILWRYIDELTGKGLNSSTIATVKDANFISEQQTDFIFSVIGEELGFVGSVLIVAIIMVLVLQCISVGRKAKDLKGMLIASGVACLIGYQSFINIGVATGLLPNTGIPLPFISYGLSSLLSICAGMGIVLNISLQKKFY